MAKPIAQSVYDRVELLCRSHNDEAVSEITGVNRSTISLMRKRGWKAVDYTPLRRPAPTDLSIQAQDMSVNELARHYHTCSRVVCRWLREKPVRPLWRAGRRKVA